MKLKCRICGVVYESKNRLQPHCGHPPIEVEEPQPVIEPDEPIEEVYDGDGQRL
jgi:hypothetical protein